MLPTDTIYTANMTQPQREWFYAEYEQARKDETVGILLALFLGTFGIHHFYLRRTGLGILYLCFFWSGITAILGFVECFLMPERVRVYNSTQATYIAGQILAQPSPAGTTQPPSEAAPFVSSGSLPTTQPCAACGKSIDPSAVFCPHCGGSRSVAV
jgi:TM2 domain-containing membrane protein YozV